METAIGYLSTLHWGAIFQIIVIDILLGGDNAVVIALACRNLPKHQRMKGILWGTAGAIVLRVILIAFAVALLQVPFLKLVGGALLVWIGVKLLLPGDDDGHGNLQGGATLWSAIKTIIVADLVMSVDNVIAIAGAAQQADPDHQMGLVIFGLVVSIPLIVWGSTLVLKLLERFPIVITLGGALLGWIAGSMMITDVATVRAIGEPSAPVHYAAALAGAVLVVVIGRVLGARRRPAVHAD
ncbi:MAG: TerC family protein [Burkholderiaceae bacterium]|nr:TerC family protein [Burkholderiaceae bacterium]